MIYPFRDLNVVPKRKGFVILMMADNLITYT